ncbi:hypothetical protein CDAR_122451 [Caerostris darwini]|uniref:Uncharacterized protein n=1 Tax=Caerostris darwini TaxID=1538125 RepID=A0AAV4M9V3_9ARAC|nr:hypothetical protein CDAR_122451 [Caerostris darwini]
MTPCVCRNVSIPSRSVVGHLFAEQEDTTEKVLLLFRFPTREGVIKNRSSDHTRSSSPTSRIVLEEVVFGPSGCGGESAAVRCLQPIVSKRFSHLFKTILCDPF